MSYNNNRCSCYDICYDLCYDPCRNNKKQNKFVAKLNGRNEFILFSKDETRLDFILQTTGLTNIISAHFHFGASGIKWSNSKDHKHKSSNRSSSGIVVINRSRTPDTDISK